ncbi:site-specific integrase [Pontibacter indicus]|uniref:Site-specific recombinase XerD n=1 Tax=Pontibacter indicus TaxID=1317125 RepID=A0A1R3XPH3_9BACT|nr:site-specific integrase [Pontibacter indicus]SIT93777.1 Site-specific recombinase XerD [Pontibacter indicus]
MDTKISILFYGRKAKTTKDKRLTIYLRVTLQGRRLELSTSRYVSPARWSAEAGKVKGRSALARSVNAYLDTLRAKAYGHHRELLEESRLVTVEAFKEKWMGVEEKPVLLLEVFRTHNEQMAQLVGRDYAPGTLERYATSLQHTRDFIRWKYGLEDMDVRKLSYQFITDYEFWFKTERNCAHNTTIKYLANFKKVIHLCLKNGWLERDPFLCYKMSMREVIREHLTKAELQRMTDKEFATDRLAQVRDVFLFSCYTGLAYVDVQQLRRADIQTGVDGEQWIFKNRQKKDTPSRIPLLPTALTILERYRDHPQCLYEDRLLPVPSNQKMNPCLKEIADVCGIEKPVTFHTARHTFATTVMLSEGVPLELVSQMPGYCSLKTNPHYARGLDRKVSQDMQQLREKLRLMGR